jgi:excisionase family DNA binding protein
VSAPDGAMKKSGTPLYGNMGESIYNCLIFEGRLFLVNDKVQMLTIKEAAKVVDGITEHRIRQMCRSGEIPYYKAGNKFLINKNVLISRFI